VPRPRLATRELQTHVGKTARAKLEIGAAPTGTVPVRLYIGESPGTRKLNITAAGLAITDSMDDLFDR